MNTIKPSCLFVEAKMDGVLMSFLVDTGSAVTILDEDIFDMLYGKIKPKQLKSVNKTLLCAKGESIPILGMSNFSFSLCDSDTIFEQEMIVGKLEGNISILGVDFLKSYSGVINFRNESLQVGKQIFPLSQTPLNLHRCARIRLCDTIKIPPDTEFYCKGYIQGKLGTDYGLVEPKQIVNVNGLLMAKTLVNPKKDEISISLLNLTNRSVRLNKNTCIADLEPVESVHYIEPQSQTHSKISKLPDHLSTLLSKVSDELNGKEKDQVKNLLTEFEDIFMKPDGKLGHTDLVEHNIDTGYENPIKIPPRRLSPKQKEIVDTELKKMLEQNIIEPSNSPWSAPVVLVTKSDGSTRFCIDFRKLNSITKKDAYPLNRIDDALEALSGAQWFSTLDLASGYWQCPLKESDKSKTAFTTHRGLYHFNVMPFGLCNAPATFSRLMNLVLGGLNWTRCLCYLDDVIVFGSTFEIALRNLKDVFECLRKANLKLKPKKCTLFQTEVAYLGHRVSKAGISCDPKKISAVQDWPIPTNVTEVRSFLGTAGYYRKFIPNFSTIASPLSQLTRKNKRFKWDENCQKAFDELKLLLVSAPILAYPIADGKFVLDTDASDTGLGGVLSQIQNGEEKVIAYASVSLLNSQRKYCTTHKELLAIVTFLKHFRNYLFGQNFLLRTDHASLKWLKNFKNPEGMIARWISIVDMYDFEIEHRRGTLHLNADGLSRIPVKRKCTREKCPDCDSPEHLANNHGLNLEVVAEEGKFPHEESKYSEQGIYPVQAIDNTSDVSNWVES